MILPLILLPVTEAYAFVLACFAVVIAAGWAHVTGRANAEIPAAISRADSPVPWIAGLIAILSISVPFSVLAQRLLGMHQRAHDRSLRLVEDLRLEIGERRAAIEALQRAEQRLTHAQKLELLGQLAGGLAHDMNNALTVIQGEASFLGEDAAESRDIIVEHANHAAQLTRQFLTLGRRDVVQPRDVDFVDEVRRATKSVRKLLPSEIEVQENYALDVAMVHADPSQLAQIVLNLVVNARDAMVGGGRLTLSVEHSDGVPGFIDLVVADTGQGIPKESLALIFEPFYSTKPEGVGTGLGLANVRELVDALGGEIRVDSNPGVGTSMRVRLPAVDGDGSASAAESDEAIGVRAVGRILLVDDRDSVRRVTRSILERDGHHVIEASNGTDAVNMLAADTAVDLVITDVVMPGGSGKNVIDWVLDHQPQTKLLVISGYAEDDRVRRVMRSGEIPFLRKPFAADELMRATQNALRVAPTPTR